MIKQGAEADIPVALAGMVVTAGTRVGDNLGEQYPRMSRKHDTFAMKKNFFKTDEHEMVGRMSQ